MSNPMMPWSVKGVSEEARAVAKAKAQEHGCTIGAWLNELILSTDDSIIPPAQRNKSALTTGSHQPVLSDKQLKTLEELPYLALALAKRIATLENDTVEFAASFQDQLSDLRQKFAASQQKQLGHGSTSHSLETSDFS